MARELGLYAAFGTIVVTSIATGLGILSYDFLTSNSLGILSDKYSTSSLFNELTGIATGLVSLICVPTAIYLGKESIKELKSRY